MEIEINRPPEKFNWFKMFWSGFMSMSPLSKSLWILVIVKLFIMYFILKPFFFPNVLDSTYKDDTDKANHVRTELFEKAPGTE